MKLLKLPVCPHCNAVYRYNEVKNMCKYKNIECRNCKKPFTVYTTKGRIIFFIVDILVLILLDILCFHFLSFNLIGLLLFTLVFFGLSLLILPFTVKFKKYKEVKLIEKNKSDDKTKRK
ncbi:MAG: hypothetical protein UIM53_01415 [Acutalibacteraceae bacterium]|nr:hypothetical protein [Acutalibacteraceae bacterium]